MPVKEKRKLGTLPRALLLAAGLGAYFLVAFWIMRRTGVGCVFLHFFGVPCPGCGMTRALRCLLDLDLAGAWRWHPLIFAMPYVLLYVLFDWKGRVHKRILSVIGILALINWVINIIHVII